MVRQTSNGRSVDCSSSVHRPRTINTSPVRLPGSAAADATSGRACACAVMRRSREDVISRESPATVRDPTVKTTGLCRRAGRITPGGVGCRVFREQLFLVVLVRCGNVPTTLVVNCCYD